MISFTKGLNSLRLLPFQNLRRHLHVIPLDTSVSLKLIKSALKNHAAKEALEVAATANGFSKLGLSDEIVKSLQDKGITDPTPVQNAVIPALLKGENLCLAASTGSGKTFAYTLPVMQMLSQHEHGVGTNAAVGTGAYTRMSKRPRCLVLVPTRELARQVLTSVKHVGHFSKMSATAVLGGETYSKQKKNLDRLVDIVVASPGRLLQHRAQGNVFFGHVTHVIIDEVDTMLTQGFGSDIRSILQGVIQRPKLDMAPPPAHSRAAAAASSPEIIHEKEHSIIPLVRPPLQLIMASATMTKAVRALLNDVEGFSLASSSDAASSSTSSSINPQQSLRHKQHKGTVADSSNNLSNNSSSIKMRLVEVEGLHHSLSEVTHHSEMLRPHVDKKDLLRDVLDRYRSSEFRTLIFCNTVASCQSLQYYLNGMAFGSASFGDAATVDHAGRQQFALSYHGDLNSREREHNLDSFRAGNAQYLVCTDIAARGLDIPEIDHVVMFDFPLNPIDYLHRAGRCGRAGREGMVTSLIAKRDQVLSKAIMTAIERKLPLDQLSSSKSDYEPGGRLADLLFASSSSAGSSSGAAGARTQGRLLRHGGRHASSADAVAPATAAAGGGAAARELFAECSEHASFFAGTVTGRSNEKKMRGVMKTSKTKPSSPVPTGRRTTAAVGGNSGSGVSSTTSSSSSSRTRSSATGSFSSSSSSFSGGKYSSIVPPVRAAIRNKTRRSGGGPKDAVAYTSSSSSSSSKLSAPRGVRDSRSSSVPRAGERDGSRGTGRGGTDRGSRRSGSFDRVGSRDSGRGAMPRDRSSSRGVRNDGDDANSAPRGRGRERERRPVDSRVSASRSNSGRGTFGSTRPPSGDKRRTASAGRGSSGGRSGSPVGRGAGGDPGYKTAPVSVRHGPTAGNRKGRRLGLKVASGDGEAATDSGWKKNKTKTSSKSEGARGVSRGRGSSVGVGARGGRGERGGGDDGDDGSGGGGGRERGRGRSQPRTRQYR